MVDENEKKLVPGEVMDEISLEDIVTVLSRRRKLIIMMTLIAMAASAIISIFLIAPVYRSSAMFMVTHADKQQQSLRSEDGLEEVVGHISRLPVMDSNTYIKQIKSTALLERVIDQLNLKDSPQALANTITATAVHDTRLIEVSVEHTDPQLATLIANTVSEEFMDFISELNQQRIGRSLDFLKQQQETVSAELTSLQSRSNRTTAVQMQIDSKMAAYNLLTKNITQAQVVLALDLGQNNLVLVDRAVEPNSPVKPNIKLNIAIAGILGLMLSVMLAFLLEYFDNSIKNADDVNKHMKLPVLAHVPKF